MSVYRTGRVNPPITLVQGVAHLPSPDPIIVNIVHPPGREPLLELVGPNHSFTIEIRELISAIRAHIPSLLLDPRLPDAPQSTIATSIDPNHPEGATGAQIDDSAPSNAINENTPL